MIFAPLIRRLLRDRRGSASIETALSLGICMVPMCLLGIEVYAYKTSIGEMARDSYHLSLAIAANPDDDLSDTEIRQRFETKFPAEEYTLQLATYCSCMSDILNNPDIVPGPSCSQSCPMSQRVRWKKVTLNRTYDPIVSKSLVGNKDLSVSHLFRTS